MFITGIPAKDLSYRIHPVHETQGLVFAIEDFLEEAKTKNYLIHDVSLIPNKSSNPKENEILVVFFFTKAKYEIVA